MTKEELLKRLEDIDGEIKTLKSQISEYESQKEDVYREIVKLLCPHKVGQKVRYTYMSEKNIGDIWYPKYERKEKTEVAVCTTITPSIHENGAIYFRYTFCKLKKDGALSSVSTYIRGKEEWLDEYYNFKK